MGQRALASGCSEPRSNWSLGRSHWRCSRCSTCCCCCCTRSHHCSPFPQSEQRDHLDPAWTWWGLPGQPRPVARGEMSHKHCPGCSITVSNVPLSAVVAKLDLGDFALRRIKNLIVLPPPCRACAAGAEHCYVCCHPTRLETWVGGSLVRNACWVVTLSLLGVVGCRYFFSKMDSDSL